MKRRGLVLVAVLVVTALAAMVAAVVLFGARAGRAAAAAAARGERAYQAALSGIRFAGTLLQRYGDQPEMWLDNPDLFQAREVARDGGETWLFTIYAPDPDDPDRVRYGVVDEGAKLDLNTASVEALAALGLLTEDQCDAILDYRDADSEPRPGGAEQAYYDDLPYPYLIPNGPLRTVEELLMVKGVSAAVVFGEDANLNGRLDPNEDDGPDRLPPDDRDGQLDPGLRDLVTVFASVPNVDSEGRRRIDLNRGRLPEGLEISDRTRRLLGLYLAEGHRFKHPAEVVGLRFQVRRPHRDFPEARPGTWVEADLAPGDLETLLDRTTATRARRLVGLVNVNTAPARVLAAAAGLDPTTARRLVDVRSGLDPEARRTVAWLYTEGVLDAEDFRRAAPRLTARSYQFTVRCVGFGVPSGRFRVLEAVVDLSGGRGGASPVRVVYLRDLTRLGLPMALDLGEMERVR